MYSFRELRFIIEWMQDHWTKIGIFNLAKNKILAIIHNFRNFALKQPLWIIAWSKNIFAFTYVFHSISG